MIMLKFELSVTLILVLSTPFLARADNDWNFSSGSVLGSQISLNHYVTKPLSLTTDWPSSRLEIDLTETAYLDSPSEKAPVTLEANTSWGVMDDDWFNNISLLNEPDTHSGTWLTKAYIQSTHRRNKWNRFFAPPLSETNDISTETTSSTPKVHKAFSWILLLLALIGWRVGRRFQNQQALDDQPLTTSTNQRFPQEAS